jgi:hypothetical protein
MSVFRDTVNELREKRLWPVAVALLVALVAVPVLLSKSSAPQPVAQLPQGVPAAAPSATALPAVSVESSPAQGKLTGAARDPFIQQKLPKPSSSSNNGTSPTGGSPSGSSAGGGSGAPTGGGSTPHNTGGFGSGPGGGSSSGGGSGGTGGGTGNPTPKPPTNPKPFPKHPPKPAPGGLRDTQSYKVTFAMTNAQGGLDTTDSLKRLSVLPSEKQPLLIELGVLKGAKRVLFVVQPGTVVSGPGTCTPGPIDCQILSLAPGDVESLAQATSGGDDLIGLFAVTDIGTTNYKTIPEAMQARRSESAAGRKLLDASTYDTLSLFRFEPSIDAVVDLRNLVVGGN